MNANLINFFGKYQSSLISVCFFDASCTVSTRESIADICICSASEFGNCSESLAPSREQKYAVRGVTVGGEISSG